MKTFAFSALLALIALLPSCSGDKQKTYTVATTSGEFEQSHSAFTGILQKHLKDEMVDYAGLKKDPAELNAYLDTLADVPESTFKKWDKDQQMAFLINLYNAATLKLIVDHYPLKSIKDIGNVLKGPWKQEVVRLFGKFETLDHVEHDLLRGNYDDPRIHFAVNCASIGCPALRPEAFQATKLDAQLEEQARKFLQDSSKNRLDTENEVLHLSPIFDWFEDDFTAESGTVEKFVTPYFKPADREVIERGGLSIENTDYDWDLNKQ